MFGLDGRTLTPKRIKKILGKAKGGVHAAVIRAVLGNQGLTAGDAKNYSDQLGQLKDIRVQADYFLQSSDPQTRALFARYGVTDWSGLAHNTLALTSNLLPSLKGLSAFTP